MTRSALPLYFAAITIAVVASAALGLSFDAIATALLEAIQ